MTSAAKTKQRPTMATLWLDGCSGCHMSFLDMDERVVELLGEADLVYSPLVDFKEFPEMVDIAIFEGAISSKDDLAKVKKIREHCRCLVSLGDCAVSGNVPSMRNRISVADLMERAYFENTDNNPLTPRLEVPELLPRVCPIHEAVEVDVYVPGCPPPADAIYYVLTELLGGRVPDVKLVTRMGA